MDLSLRHIERSIYTNLIRTKPTPHISLNGKRPTLVCLEDLGDEAVRKYYAELQSPVPPAEELPPPPKKTVPRPANLSECPEWAIIEANQRAEIVKAALEIKTSNRKKTTHALKEFAAQRGISRSTLSGWMAAYKKEEYMGLIPRWGRGAAIDAAVENFIKQEYLKPTQPLISHIYEKTITFCQEVRRPAPSYSTVVRVIQTIDEGVKTYYRIGKKAWKDVYEPILRRDFSDLMVGEIICGDHREFDVFVRVGEKVFRPWLTAWMDLRSRKLTGWHIDIKPSSRTIAIAFRNSVLTHGRPKVVYKDNGKDYRCHYLNGKTEAIGKVELDSETKGIFGYLNVDVIDAIPYSARSKPIERFFLNIPQRLERYQTGWCGRDNKSRPEKLAAELKSEKLLTLEELRGKFEEFISDYHARTHSELGCAPADLWKDAVMEIPDERAMDMLLMKAKNVHIYNDGIRLNTLRYWASELSGYVGVNVDVRYNPADVGRLYIFMENKFLCEAVNAKAASMKTGEADIKQKAREKKAARERLNRHAQDVRIVHSPDEALKVAVGMREEISPSPGQLSRPAGGEVVRLITGLEGIAKQVPEPVEYVEEDAGPSAWDLWQKSVNAEYEDWSQKREADRQAEEESRKRNLKLMGMEGYL